MAMITLLTDFGVQDEYVGVLKGVILSTDPNATIVDISHGIQAQDTAAAALMLKASFAYFPRGTVHVIVVDPGVGTQRAIIAADCDGHLFLAPDNGILEPILQEGKSATIYRVENDMLFLHPVSRTFQGRDIFAPVAGHLSKGMSLNRLGPIIGADEIIALGETSPQMADSGEIIGKIVAVDRFGNLITNIHVRDLVSFDNAQLSITVGEHTIRGLTESYAHSGSDGPIAIFGSRDCIEIALNLGNAADELQMGAGGIVRVMALSAS